MDRLIRHTWDDGLKLYPTGKTESWLQSIGLQLPKEVASFLTEDYSCASKAMQAPTEAFLLRQGYSCTQAMLASAAYGQGYGSLAAGCLEAQFTQDQARQVAKAISSRLPEETLLEIADPAAPPGLMLERRIAAGGRHPPAPGRPPLHRSTPSQDAGKAREAAEAHSRHRTARPPSGGKTRRKG